MDILTISEKFRVLKLSGMAQALEQMKIPAKHLTYCLGLVDELIDCQADFININRQFRLQRAAKLRWPDATLGDFDSSHEKTEVIQIIERCSTSNWALEHQHVVIVGFTGAGKTTLACALANQAIQHGISVKMFRYSELLFELGLAEKEGALHTLIAKLVKIKILLIDDWGIAPLNSTQRYLLFELIEKREQRGSLLITSQYGFDQWHAAFQDETVGDAVLDRIVHMSHVIKLENDSLRKQYGINGKGNMK
jgi:DNA replication protein DnaC